MKPRCIVMGGTGYVGSAVVRRLAAAGAEVAFSYCTQADAAKALASATGAQAFHFSAEARDVSAVDAAFAGEPMTALVQCIGTAGNPALYREHDNAYDKLMALSPDDWASMHDITVTTTFAVCQRLAPRLASHGAGANVVVIGSIDGVKPVPAPIHYAAGKGAVAGMVRALAKALGPRGVCVNLLAAGILEGGIGLHLSESLRTQYLKHCALKRLGKAAEIAEMAAWFALCNRYVSAQAIVVDGGL